MGPEPWGGVRVKRRLQGRLTRSKTNITKDHESFGGLGVDSGSGSGSGSASRSGPRSAHGSTIGICVNESESLGVGLKIVLRTPHAHVSISTQAFLKPGAQRMRRTCQDSSSPRVSSPPATQKWLHLFHPGCVVRCVTAHVRERGLEQRRSVDAERSQREACASSCTHLTAYVTGC